MSTGNRGGASPTGLAEQVNSDGNGSAEEQSTADGEGNTSLAEGGPPQVSDRATVETVGAQPQTQQSEYRAQADLEAQQDMAFWAMLMFFATLATVAITAIGVWFVKRTLDATLEAVEDTGKGTEAMVEANKINREMFEHTRDVNKFQVGAVIDITAANIRGGLKQTYKIENIGKSIAFNTRISGSIIIRVGDQKFTNPIEEHVFPQLSPEGPSKGMVIQIANGGALVPHIPRDESLENTILSGGESWNSGAYPVSCVVEITSEYETVFGDAMKSVFTFRGAIRICTRLAIKTDEAGARYIEREYDGVEDSHFTGTVVRERTANDDNRHQKGG